MLQLSLGGRSSTIPEFNAGFHEQYELGNYTYMIFLEGGGG